MMLPEDSRLKAWRKAAPGFLRRRAKHLGQARYGWLHERHVTFVFGCQRSGTKMLMRVFDQSPQARIFHENHLSAFSDFRLRSDPVIHALVAMNPAPTLLFKPICDSHISDRLLDRFERARGLWIYREPGDVANSAVHKWGDHQRDIVDAVARGDLETWGWRTERLPEHVVDAIRRVHRPDLSAHEGALLFWYMRNSFFFDVNPPRTLLVRYEDLARDPSTTFPPVFEHIGAPFDPAYVADVRASSVGRHPAPEASPAILDLCGDLLRRLDEAR